MFCGNCFHDNALVTALRDGRPGEIYNAADDEPVTQLHFFAWLSEVLGKNPRIWKSGVHGPEVYEGMWRMLAAGETWRGLLVNKTKAGKHIREDVVISPIREASGEITGYVSGRLMWGVPP